jgi:hypothetical protein
MGERRGKGNTGKKRVKIRENSIKSMDFPCRIGKIGL